MMFNRYFEIFVKGIKKQKKTDAVDFTWILHGHYQLFGVDSTSRNATGKRSGADEFSNTKSQT